MGGLWGEYLSLFSILDDWGWVFRSIFLWIVGAKGIKYKFFEFLGGGAEGKKLQIFKVLDTFVMYQTGNYNLASNVDLDVVKVYSNMHSRFRVKMEWGHGHQKT